MRKFAAILCIAALTFSTAVSAEDLRRSTSMIAPEDAAVSSEDKDKLPDNCDLKAAEVDTESIKNPEVKKVIEDILDPETEATLKDLLDALGMKEDTFELKDGSTVNFTNYDILTPPTELVLEDGEGETTCDFDYLDEEEETTVKVTLKADALTDCDPANLLILLIDPETTETAVLTADSESDTENGEIDVDFPFLGIFTILEA